MADSRGACFTLAVDVSLIDGVVAVDVPACVLDVLARQEVAEAVLRGVERMLCAVRLDRASALPHVTLN